MSAKLVGKTMSRLASEPVPTTTRIVSEKGPLAKLSQNVETVNARQLQVQEEHLRQGEVYSVSVSARSFQVEDRFRSVRDDLKRVDDPAFGQCPFETENVIGAFFDTRHRLGLLPPIADHPVATPT